MAYDAEKIASLENNFNFLFGITSFEHFENQKSVINGAFQISDQKGRILIIIPSHYSYLNYWKHGYRRYSKSSLKTLINGAGFKIIESGKIGGLFSFFFHFIWVNTGRAIQKLLKLIIFILFGWNNDKARSNLPKLFIVLDNFVHLHLKFKIGRFIHRSLIITTNKLDKILPIFEIGYYCIGEKQ